MIVIYIYRINDVTISTTKSKKKEEKKGKKNENRTRNSMRWCSTFSHFVIILILCHTFVVGR